VDLLPHEVEAIRLGVVLPEILLLLFSDSIPLRLLKASDFQGLQQEAGQALFPLTLLRHLERPAVPVSGGHQDFDELGRCIRSMLTVLE
jgi:hypothetical protein